VLPTPGASAARTAAPGPAGQAAAAGPAGVLPVLPLVALPFPEALLPTDTGALIALGSVAEIRFNVPFGHI
jgi:hypothetical protein